MNDLSTIALLAGVICTVVGIGVLLHAQATYRKARDVARKATEMMVVAQERLVEAKSILGRAHQIAKGAPRR